jgi:hypothetical protein
VTAPSLTTKIHRLLNDLTPRRHTEKGPPCICGRDPTERKLIRWFCTPWEPPL